jgi:hypothetical protein
VLTLLIALKCWRLCCGKGVNWKARTYAGSIWKTIPSGALRFLSQLVSNDLCSYGRRKARGNKAHVAIQVDPLLPEKEQAIVPFVHLRLQPAAVTPMCSPTSPSSAS